MTTISPKAYEKDISDFNNLEEKNRFYEKEKSAQIIQIYV